MRNYFLYAPTESDRFSTTTRILKKHLKFGYIITLAPGWFHGSPASHELRYGDIVIVYAATPQDLRSLSSQADEFQDYNLILILHQTISEPYHDAIKLGPRYINIGPPNITEMSDIINKITKKLDCAAA